MFYFCFVEQNFMMHETLEYYDFVCMQAMPFEA